MMEVPTELRHLKDFPAYDASFQDGPNFRQSLSHWALRTEKLANAFTSLSETCQRFHESGVEHYKSATKMVSCVQSIGGLCNNTLGQSVAGPMHKICESLTNLWCYHEVFLGQTQMLSIGPIRELAATFCNLKKLYEELLHYRDEYRSAAEKLCSCRHMARLPDKTTFAAMTESCYSAEKTYRLILCKYLTLLRQAHTKDIMVFVRRFMEHVFSLFAYHTNAATMLRDLEPEVNDFFSQSKDWQRFYEEELTLWSKLHHSVQRHIMAEFQLNVGLIPHPEGNNKPHKLKKFPSNPSKKEIKSIVISAPLEADSSINPLQAMRKFSEVKPPPHNGYPVTPTKKPEKRPLGRTQSSPLVDPEEVLLRSSEVDLGSSCEILNEDCSILDSIEIRNAAEAMEQVMQRSTSHSVSSGSPSLFQAVRGRLNKRRKKSTAETLVDDPPSGDEERSSSGTPPEGQSPVMPRKSKTSGLFRIGRRRGKDTITKLKPSASQPEKLGQEFPVLKEEPLSPPPTHNGHEDLFERGRVLRRNRDPSHRVSGPLIKDHKEKQASYNLQKMVLPLPKAWTKCGYLWLRMKLPNNIYAWTYIYCVVDKDRGELMIQEQSLPQPRKLENLMLCNTRACKPDFIDRNYCFRVISPTTEHLFQAVNEQQMSMWVSALQETTEEALKRTDHLPSRYDLMNSTNSIESMDVVPHAMKEIRTIQGNKECADCSSTIEVEWASVNLGIVLCIKCSGVHRGLGVHVSKVRSLNLDKWDRPTVDFMVSQGNKKSNSYYESTLGDGLFPEDIKRPSHNSKKDVRALFIQQKYVALAFVPECGDNRDTQL